LANDARVTIHVMHRLGALVVLALSGSGWLAVDGAIPKSQLADGRLAIAGFALASSALGIANVVLRLPLPVAVAHNGGAALLLLALVTLNHLLRPEPAA
jgi:cytochrome c oxidase assembly protein subunit 15